MDENIEEIYFINGHMFRNGNHSENCRLCRDLADAKTSVAHNTVNCGFCRLAGEIQPMSIEEAFENGC